ncbi:MAG: membrane integrity-associated transporter subunit PqiC [Candidatus Omnitrophica bacterium]|nr:membrane integrity-associated transporter subunit PqiC [Candidatus Omnitrophota bacterium]
MKQFNRNFFAIGFLFLGLGGCVSAQSSPTSRFYALSSVRESPMGQTIKMSSDVIIGVGPVKIPQYLDRPQMVTINKDKMLKFAQFDRWAEILDLGLARQIREDLTGLLPGVTLTMYPWSASMPVKYQVIVEIVQLDSELDKDVSLVAQWQIMDTQNVKMMMIKRSEFRQPIVLHNYSGLAQTLSVVCTSLSTEIAHALADLDTLPKK